MNGTVASPSSEFESCLNSHAQYYGDLVRRKGPWLRGSGLADGGRGQRHALRALKLELDNTLLAIESMLAGSADVWDAASVERFWEQLSICGQFPLMHKCASEMLLCARGTKNYSLAMGAGLGLADAFFHLGANDDSQQITDMTYQLAQEHGDVYFVAASLQRRGMLAFSQGDYTAAAEAYELALDRYTELGDHSGMATVTSFLGAIQFACGNCRGAMELQERSLGLCRACGDVQGEAFTIGNMGNVAFTQGDMATARNLFQKVLDLRRELGEPARQAWALMSLGNVACAEGEYVAAECLLEEALQYQRDLGDQRGELWAIYGKGNAALQQRKLSEAVDLFSHALANAERLADRYAEAVMQHNLATVDLELRRFESAASRYQKSVELRLHIGDKPGLIVLFMSVGVLLALASNSKAAVILLYGAVNQSTVLGYPFPADDQRFFTMGMARVDAAVANGEVSANNLARWRAEGEAMTLDELAEFTLAALREAQSSLPR